VARAVEAVDGLRLDVLDGLTGLAEKSLVRLVDLAGSEPRVRMLETIREFAADRLEQAPEFNARVCRAHATYYADLARRLRGDLTGKRREAALTAMAADVANLRVAWSYWTVAGDFEQLEKMADSLLILYDARGWYLDIVNLTTDMLAVLGTSSSSPDRVGQEIALRTSLARALMATKGFTPEVEEAFASVIELFERGTDGRRQFGVLRGLAGLYTFQARFDKVAGLAQEILELGELQGDPRMAIDGHLLVGTTMVTLDDLQGGLDHLDQAIAVFATGPTYPTSARVGTDPRISSYTTSGFALWLLGFPDRAVERDNAALALAAELEHPFTSAYAQFHAGLLRLWRQEWDLALDLATGLLEIADESAFRIWTAVGTVLQGAAQVGVGRSEDGLANIRTGMGLYQELRSPPVFWPFLLLIDATASHRAGRSADGLRPIETAIEIMSPGGGTVFLPELQLLKGDLLVALGDAAGSGAGGDGGAEGQAAAPRGGAEGWYQKAFDRAGVLGARMTRLRAATQLARLRVAGGDPAGAARVLSPVYATFTEGFGTADLREARELLDAVAAGERRSAPA
jgi:adenylate cyclase